MDKDTLKQSEDLNDAIEDAFCLYLYEIAKGQRDGLNEHAREFAQAMMEIAERETGHLPDVIMLLEVYCAFHPDVPYAVAREKVLKATESVSEGGLKMTRHLRLPATKQPLWFSETSLNSSESSRLFRSNGWS
jgi:hypothetical protein